jgi:hypothetical protein
MDCGGDPRFTSPLKCARNCEKYFSSHSRRQAEAGTHSPFDGLPEVCRSFGDRPAAFRFSPAARCHASVSRLHEWKIEPELFDRVVMTIGSRVVNRRPTFLGAIAFVAGATAAGARAFASSGGDVPTTILDLQPFRQSQSVRITSAEGREGSATLTNLNPAINAWHVLTITWQDGMAGGTYHLENPKPQTRKLVLDPQRPSGIFIEGDTGPGFCELFAEHSAESLERGRKSGQPYYSLCNGNIYLRNAGVGHRTSLEAATEFFRDRVWGGEAVIEVGHQIMADANLETGLMQRDAGAATAARARTQGPARALIDPAFWDRMIAVPDMGIGMAEAAGGKMAPGVWYATGTPGSFVSVFQPNLVPPDILKNPGSALPLDDIEASALCYLIAFDLDRFTLEYARGTVHPQVGWSAHIQPQMKVALMPGPDGIGDINPLVATGLLAPYELRRTVATFTAGFKRAHGAFLYGDLATVNRGSHYGFIENGVVFSHLVPGLSTIFVRKDGSVDMKTWEQKDDELLRDIRFARQNGVPIVELDPASHAPRPGRLVKDWGAGNWSGSADRKLRTMRSGVALYTSGATRYVIYGVFSSATPSAMARVFMAYRCQYAMLLDMNALEHTYLAFYPDSGTERTVEYLMRGMSQVDAKPSVPGAPPLRFVGYPDNRDFFSVLKFTDERGNP